MNSMETGSNGDSEKTEDVNNDETVGGLVHKEQSDEKKDVVDCPKPKMVVRQVVNEPDFAVVCDFVARFGPMLNVWGNSNNNNGDQQSDILTISQLECMLDDTNDKSNLVNEEKRNDFSGRRRLIELQVRLLRRLKRSVSWDKWERAFVKFAHSYSSSDAFEIEKKGYNKVKASIKLRLLKNLLEAQFDINPKLKSDLSKLRSHPIGSDKLGNSYWYQMDDQANVRVYKEDHDEETWELVAENRQQLEELITHLKDNDTFSRRQSNLGNAASVIEDMEDESMQGIEDILMDTGPSNGSNTGMVTGSALNSAYNSDNEDSETVKRETTQSPSVEIDLSTSKPDTRNETNKANTRVAITTTSTTTATTITTMPTTSPPHLTIVESVKKLPFSSGVSKSSSLSKHSIANLISQDPVPKETKEPSSSVAIQEPSTLRFGQGSLLDNSSTSNQQKSQAPHQISMLPDDSSAMVRHSTNVGAHSHVGTSKMAKEDSCMSSQSTTREMSRTTPLPSKDVISTGEEEALTSRNNDLTKSSLKRNEEGEQPEIGEKGSNEANFTCIKQDESKCDDIKYKRKEEEEQASVEERLKEDEGKKEPERSEMLPNENRKEGEHKKAFEEKGKAQEEQKQLFDARKENMSVKNETDPPETKEKASSNPPPVQSQQLQCAEEGDVGVLDGKSVREEHPTTEQLSVSEPNEVNHVEKDHQALEKCAVSATNESAHLDGKQSTKDSLENQPEPQSQSLVEENESQVQNTHAKNDPISIGNQEETENDLKLSEKANKSAAQDLLHPIPDDNDEKSQEKPISEGDKYAKNDEPVQRDKGQSEEESKGEDVTVGSDGCEIKSLEETEKESRVIEPSETSDAVNQIASNEISEPTEHVVQSEQSGSASESSITKSDVTNTNGLEKLKDLDQQSPLQSVEKTETSPMKHDTVDDDIHSVNVTESSKEESSPQPGSESESEHRVDMNASEEGEKVSKPDSVKVESPSCEKLQTEPSEARNPGEKDHDREVEDKRDATTTSSGNSNDRQDDSGNRGTEEDQSGPKSEEKGVKRGAASPTIDEVSAEKKSKLQSSVIEGAPKAPSFSEVMESEPLIVKGEGNGAACDAGNPATDASDTQNGTGDTKEEEVNESEPTEEKSSKSSKKCLIGDESYSSDIFAPLPRRSSGRIAALRIKEAERRQQEEEAALGEFKKLCGSKKSKGKRRGDENYEDIDDHDGDDDDDDADVVIGGISKNGRKRRRRSKKKKRRKGDEAFKQFERFCSGDSSDEEADIEEQVAEEYEEYEEEEDNLFKSDHEFSCESDVPDEEAQPIQHARTATKKRRKGRQAKEEQIVTEKEEEDTFACKKCNRADHPEWILLCDKCDVGWHASCLRPSLMVIPEGNWYCPDCNHLRLVEQLEENLLAFDALLKRREADIKRKERLAFVSLSLSNIIPTSNGRKTTGGVKVEDEEEDEEDEEDDEEVDASNLPRKAPRVKKRKARADISDSDDDDDESEISSRGRDSSLDSEEDEKMDEGLFGKRRKATKNVTYSLKKYDDMIKSALAADDYDEDADEPSSVKEVEGEAEEEGEERGEDDFRSPTGRSGLGMGKDIGNCEWEEDEDKADADNKEDEDNDSGEKPKVTSQLSLHKDNKKKKKLSDLNASDSDNDEDSGSDFEVDSLNEDEEEEEDEEVEDEDDEEDEDEDLRRENKRGSHNDNVGVARRRSKRSRKVIYDSDFVIDGSDSEDDEEASKKRGRGETKGRGDESWDDEDEEDDLEDLEERYSGAIKKKSKSSFNKSSSKSKKMKHIITGSNEEDEEEPDRDFEMKVNRKQKRKLQELASNRTTRGKKVSYSGALSDEDDEEDALLLKLDAEAKRKNTLKKKKGRKWESSESEDDSLPDLDDEEEEDDDD